MPGKEGPVFKVQLRVEDQAIAHARKAHGDEAAVTLLLQDLGALVISAQRAHLWSQSAFAHTARAIRMTSPFLIIIFFFLFNIIFFVILIFSSTLFFLLFLFFPHS